MLPKPYKLNVGLVCAGKLALAVIVDPFSPKVTLLELLNVIALRLFDVVPPLTLIAVKLVAIDPVIVEPFRPKLIPLLLLNVTADKF